MAQHHELDLLRMLEEAVSAEKKDTGRIVEHFHECRGLGIEILPLDINRSEASCVCESEDALRLGFSALGFQGEQFLEDLMAERQKNGPFQRFQDFCERVDTEELPKSFFIKSIKAGAYDSLGDSRSQLLKGFERVIQAVRNAKAEKAANQISLFATLPAAAQGQTLSVSLPEAEAWSEEQRVEYEKDALGFSFTEYLVQLEEEQSESSKETGGANEALHPEGFAATDELFLQLPVQSVTEAQLLQLRTLCGKYPGPSPLCLKFIDETQQTTMIQVNQKYYVRDDEELRKEIHALFEKVSVLRER